MKIETSPIEPVAGHDDDMAHRRAACELRGLGIAWRTGHSRLLWGAENKCWGRLAAQCAKSCCSERKPLNSSALPDGSRMKSVACSPGSPAKRIIGRSIQSTPGLGLEPVRELAPVLHQQHHAEMRDRHRLAVDLAEAVRWRGGPHMRRHLVAVEVEIHPGVGGAADRAAEHAFIEGARRVEIAHGKGKVERRHGRCSLIWPDLPRRSTRRGRPNRPQAIAQAGREQ